MAIVNWPQRLLGLEIRKKLGKEGEPDPLDVYGIYRVWRRWGKRQNLRHVFYVPFNPQSPDQQANREKFADAVLAWQGLTEEEKMAYNKRAKGKYLSGYNLFIREFMYG